MWREQALKVVLVLVGLLFTAAIYPMTQILWYRDQPKYETAMGLAVYATLGIMLLMAMRNPSAHRSLIVSVRGTQAGRIYGGGELLSG